MGFSCGIIGLPNAGKTTIFNALTQASAEVSSYPFCTISPNKGIVPVVDERLDILAKSIDPERVIPATLEFVDIAGLVRGASKGAGLGNQFLGYIREVDVISQIVRCFENTNISHLEGSIDPRRDAEVVNTEMLLADLETMQRLIQKTEKLIKGKDREASKEKEVLLREIEDCLNRGEPARRIKERKANKYPKNLNLLTEKPLFYIANVGDEFYTNKRLYFEELKEFADSEKTPVIPICGQIEYEVLQLESEDRGKFLISMGIEETGLNRLVRLGYELLNLVTFFTTVGKREVRAWTVPAGTTAFEASGKIHSDFQKGFIRAEVISWEDFVKIKSEHIAREKGLIRSEGKEYLIKDGDIVNFKFNI